MLKVRVGLFHQYRCYSFPIYLHIRQSTVTIINSFAVTERRLLTQKQNLFDYAKQLSQAEADLQEAAHRFAMKQVAVTKKITKTNAANATGVPSYEEMFEGYIRNTAEGQQARRRIRRLKAKLRNKFDKQGDKTDKDTKSKTTFNSDRLAKKPLTNLELQLGLPNLLFLAIRNTNCMLCRSEYKGSRASS